MGAALKEFAPRAPPMMEENILYKIILVHCKYFPYARVMCIMSTMHLLIGSIFFIHIFQLNNQKQKANLYGQLNM